MGNKHSRTAQDSAANSSAAELQLRTAAGKDRFQHRFGTLLAGCTWTECSGSGGYSAPYIAAVEVDSVEFDSAPCTAAAVEVAAAGTAAVVSAAAQTPGTDLGPHKPGLWTGHKTVAAQLCRQKLMFLAGDLIGPLAFLPLQTPHVKVCWRVLVCLEVKVLIVSLKKMRYVFGYSCVPHLESTVLCTELMYLLFPSYTFLKRIYLLKTCPLRSYQYRRHTEKVLSVRCILQS